MPFYRITIELKGKTLTGIRVHSSDTDNAFLAFRHQAHEHFKDKMLYFDCVQLSNYSEEVILFRKLQGRTGKTMLDPEPDDLLGLGQPNDADTVFNKRPGKR